MEVYRSEREPGQAAAEYVTLREDRFAGLRAPRIVPLVLLAAVAIGVLVAIAPALFPDEKDEAVREVALALLSGAAAVVVAVRIWRRFAADAREHDAAVEAARAHDAGVAEAQRRWAPGGEAASVKAWHQEELLAYLRRLLDAEPRVRRRLPLEGVDLRDAQLPGVDLRDSDMAGARLDGANLQGAHLALADLAGAVLRRADLRRANLRGANLAGAQLDGARLADASYDELTIWPEGIPDASQYGAIPERSR